MGRPHPLVLLGVFTLAAIVVLATYVLVPPPPAAPLPPSTACGYLGGSPLYGQNVTSELPASFANGSLQSFGSNATSVMLGGVSFYQRNANPYDSLPALGTYDPGNSAGQDLTARTADYFDEGGVFPVGWNGTSWLVAGQTSIGPLSEGSAISIQGDTITNLTPVVAPYFQGQGIWIAGWNGQGWLLGGNNSQGAALIYLQGDSVTNLTGLLPDNLPGDWIQMVAWNGTGWLVGGEGIFGAYEGSTFTNLLPQSPFATGGVLAFDWNGSAWLAGGSPLDLATVQGTRVDAFPLPVDATQGWVNSIVSMGGASWLVSGGGYGSSGDTPFVQGVDVTTTGATSLDETRCLGGAFQGGYVQYSAWAPAYGPHDLLLVGERGSDPTTYSSQAAAAVITVGG